nr:YciI family protein [Polycyclovorans algicola]
MRYMILVKATAQSEADAMPTEAKLSEMAQYHEALQAAGLLVEGNGLQASRHGWRVQYNGAKRSVIDGPFAESKELIAGYTLINVDSPEQAREWTQRFPNPTLDDSDTHIEVRRLFELEDFAPGPGLDAHHALDRRQKDIQSVPAGMHSITPHLECEGASDAIAFYKAAFDAIEEARLPGPDGRLMHAQIRIGNSTVMLADPFSGCASHRPERLTGSPVCIHLYVADADATFARAIAAGATVIMPLSDMFWGDRYGQLEDPFGHRWSIATHLRDVSPEDCAAALAAMPEMSS